MMTTTFPERMKRHQRTWLLSHGYATEEFEEGRKESWVLTRATRARNLFDPLWLSYLGDKPHRWFNSLLSSQAFAVNIFGPLAHDRNLARRVLSVLWPEGGIRPTSEVRVRFEVTPDGAPGWLGERGQPTQIDVFIEVSEEGRPMAFLLVEVKFTEAEIGTCRGALGTEEKGPNPRPERCRDLEDVLGNPGQQCYMAETEGRQYWEYLSEAVPGLRDLPAAGACPFRHGLYQLMRSLALARAMEKHIPGSRVETGVCFHPGNQAVRLLAEPVGGCSDAIDALRLVSGGRAPREIDPAHLIAVILSKEPGLGPWAEWMTGRYDLGEPTQLGRTI